MRWYLSKDGQTTGPFEPGVIALWHAQGQIQPDTIVCREGDDRWIPFERSVLAAPPTKPRSLPALLLIALPVGALLFCGFGVLAGRGKPGAANESAATVSSTVPDERPIEPWYPASDLDELAEALSGKRKPDFVDKTGTNYVVETHEVATWSLVSVMRAHRDPMRRKLHLEGGDGSRCKPERWAPSVETLRDNGDLPLSSKYYALRGGPFDGLVVKAFINAEPCMWHLATPAYARAEGWPVP